MTIVPTPTTATEHRLQLGASMWSVWRQAVLRSTGFPVSGLHHLSAEELADAADAYLGGQMTAVTFTAAFEQVMTSLAARMGQIVTDPRFREAAAWEPAPAVIGLDALADGTGGARDGERRQAQTRLARLWQRYCAINDTIGFFGPFRWITLDPAQAAMLADPAPSMFNVRRLFFEPWAMAAYGARLAADPQLRRWLPAYRRTHYQLTGLLVRRPGQAPVEVTAAEAAAIAACDGRKPGEVVAAQLVDRAVVPGGDHAGALALLEGLVERRLLEWDENLPVTFRTEEILDQRIAAIRDEALRRRAGEGLVALRSARDRVAAAVGDADALREALTALDQVFTEVTGRPAHRPGYTHPGHGVVYEDTLRDVAVGLGWHVLDTIEPALAIVLASARWLTAQLAERFDAALAHLIQSQPGGHPCLADVWDAAVDLLLGPRDQSLFAGVLKEFESRWRALIELDDGRREVRLVASALQERSSALFCAERPGWSLARIHSPDILLCAPSVDAINDGQYTAVLGELHIAYATLCVRTMTWALPDPDRYLHHAVQDYGGLRLIPLMPRLWSDYAGRSLQFDDETTDRYLSFARATGVDTDRIIATCSVAIGPGPDGPVGRMPDGTVVALREFFAPFLSMCVTNALREVMRGAHTPRVTIDRLVVWRETWRLTHEEIASLAGHDETAVYLAGRRLVAARGLTSRCFARLSTDKKPIYVDFTSPLWVGALGTLVSAGLAKNPGLEVTLTEMLPGPHDTWLADAQGNRYQAEFRLQMTDPTLPQR
jgi:hypothetical protein